MASRPPQPALPEDFWRQAMAFLDGALSAEESDRFSAQLAESEERRQAFVDLCLHARLMREQLADRLADKGAGDEAVQPAVTNRPAFRSAWSRAAVGWMALGSRSTYRFFSRPTP